MTAQKKYQQGFTLLELLVALSIFTLIGIGGYAFLQSVVKGRTIAKAHSENITQLQKAVYIITQDIAQMESPASAAPAGDYLLSFTRRGWNNPLLRNRSDRLAIAYKIEHSSLLRYYWPAEQPGTAPQKQVLLTDITDFTLRPLLPHMFEAIITVPHYGEIRRVVEVPEP